VVGKGEPGFAEARPRIGQLAPGTTVYVDGPHGVFSMDQDEGPGFCFIGGGVGITGLMVFACLVFAGAQS
jgi:predicted ferric reductase